MSDNIGALVAMLHEQGAWADGCSVLTCGPTTGHFVHPIAFCATPEAASILAAALSLCPPDRIADRVLASRTKGEQT